MFWRKLPVPKSNETVQVTVAQLWSVRWMRRTDKWHNDLDPVAEFFTSEEDAKHFADSLRAAFKLVRNTSKEDTTVTVRKEP